MRQVSVDAGDAARGVWRSTVAALGRTPETATLVQRGRAAIWDALVSIAAEHASMVSRVVLDENDRHWAPDRVDVSDGQDVLWYHDPFDRPVGTGAENDRILAATRTVSLLVVLSYPHGLSDDALQMRVESVFDRALCVDPAAVERTSVGLLEILGRARNVRVGDDLVIDLPLPGRTDFTSIALDLPVLQLPLGECWLVLNDPTELNGTVQAWVGVHRLAELTIVAGRLHGPNDSDLGMVGELGFGVSTAVRALPGTTLPEKALGLVHLGLGDNRAIGGQVAGLSHTDVALSPETEVVCGLPSGLDLRLRQPAISPQWMVTHRRGRTRHRDLRDNFLGPIQGNGAGVISLFGEASDGSISNTDALSCLPDPRESELIRLSHDAVDVVGAFTFAGQHQEAADDVELGALWDLMIEQLGVLPWPQVRLVAVECARWSIPRALSVPGMVLFDRALLGRPLTWRWLYLAHELAHQWVGGTFRLGPAHRSAWEDVCEGIAHASASTILGPDSSAVFQRLRQRQKSLSGLTARWSDPTHGRALLRAIARDSLDGPLRSEDVPVPGSPADRGEEVPCSPTR